MNYNKATLFAFLFILILGMGFAQVSTSSVSYEREDRAVISDAYGTLAHVELDNSYTKVGSEMYLQDCGLTTCYLTLVITPDTPLDSRTIIGRVAGGNAEYVGAEVYETRVVPVPRNVYKTVERNYTEKNNVTNTTKIIFYNETVLDKVVIDNLPVADWYALNPELSAGVPRIVRLEYHKEPWAKADLVPELNGVRVEGWAWWNSSWTSYQEINITDADFQNISYYFNLTVPVTIGAEVRATTNSSGTETECGGIWRVGNWTTTEEYILNCTLANGTNSIKIYYNNNTGVSDVRNVSKACFGGDDFPGSSLNSRWAATNTPVVSGGLLEIQADDGATLNTQFYKANNMVMMGFGSLQSTGGSAHISVRNITATHYAGILGSNTVAPNGKYKARAYDGTVSDSDTTIVSTPTYQFYKVSKTNGRARYYINNTLYITKTANVPTVSMAGALWAGGSAPTAYWEWACQYDELGNYGINATFSAWSGEINDTSTPTNITPFTVTNQNYTIPQVETVKYNYSINYTLGTNDTSSSSANLEYLGVNFTGTCSNVSKNYSCYYNGLESAIVAINNSQNDVVWIIEVTNESGSRWERAPSVTIGTIWGAWPSNTSSIIDIVEGATFNTTAYYTTASGVNMTLIAALTFNTSYGTAVCSGGSCVVNQTAPSVSSATIYGMNGSLNVSSPFWRYYGGNVTEAVRNVSLFQNYSITSGYTMSYSGTVTNPNNANDSNWGTGATLNDGAAMTFNYTLNQLYNLTWYVKDSAATRALAVPSDCWRENVSLRVSRAGTYFRYWCRNYTNDAYVNFSQVTPGTYVFYEQNLSALRNNTMTRVLPFGITDCSVGSVIMTFNIMDEDTNAPLIANYSQDFFLTYLGSVYGFHFDGEDDTFSRCIYPPGLVATYTSNEQYESSGYGTRLYSITTTSTTTSVNYSRYLGYGPSDYTFIAQDQFGSDIYHVNVTVTKFNFVTNTWETVSNTMTDYTGAAVFYLTPFDLYHLYFQKSGYSSVDFDFTPSTVSSIIVTMTKGTGVIHPPPDLETMWDDVNISFSPDEGYYNESQTLTFTIGSAGSLLQSWGVNITFISPINGTATQVYFANTTVLPGGGSMSYITANNGTYTVRAFWKHYNYSFYQPTPRVYYINMNATGLVKAKVLLGTSNILSGWALYFALLVVAMVVAGFIARYSMEGAALGGLLVLWFGSLMFPAVCVVALFGGFCLTPVYVTALATITGVAAILAFRGIL